jgi:hypothetical protein
VHPSKRRLYRDAATTDGVFCIDDARRVGLTEKQIRSASAHEWNTLYEGVYLAPGAPLTWKGRVRAACLAGAPNAAVSHRAGAAFYGVPGGNRALVEITCPRWLRAKSSGLLVHERSLVLPGDVQMIDGIPVTRPELCALQLASIYRSAEFIERVLHAMRRHRLITYDSTLEMLTRHARKGVRGVRVMREALAQWDPGSAATESDPETVLLQILRRHGIEDAVPQLEIFDEAGRFVARLDVGIPRWRIGIEYDSNQFHTDEFAIERDNSRRNRVFSTGWTIFTARRRDLRTGGHELMSAIRAHIPAPHTAPKWLDSAQVS